MTEKLLEGVFLSLLLWVPFGDVLKREIPDGIPAAMILLAAADMWSGGMALPERLAGLLCISLPMTAITMVRPGAFGGGDIAGSSRRSLLGAIRMIAAGGIAVLLCGIVLTPLVLTRRITGKESIPFGPFLSAGMAAGLLWGKEIAAWYTGSGAR